MRISNGATTPLPLQTSDASSFPANQFAANGAPAGEPEVWDANVAVYTPLRGHAPEPAPVAISPSLAAEFNISNYLAEEREKDLLRFSTAGSVDDGKSTLIGRLLYDTQSVYDDQIRSIEGKGTTAPGVLDLALLTDGLRAEREQGITIDVAYRYFSTARRKFIIADTPGHEQYTRNMATGASTADVAIVLIDARKGVLLQSRRHAYITALLGVPNIIVAVNKMDLVAYSELVFAKIVSDFRTFFASLQDDGHATALHFVPLSALAGDNVVHRSTAMPWYTGSALLEFLETIPSVQGDIDAPFRMAVQRVVRPDLDFRGFAGQIASGSVRPGDEVLVQPSGQRSRVERIVTYDGDLALAHAPLSVTLTLADEIDISRGDVLVAPNAPANVHTALRAALVWMDATPLSTGRRYQLKSGSRSVQAQITALLRVVDLNNPAGKNAATQLGMNGIGDVEVQLLQPLAFDGYTANRHTGSFILIDSETNATVAAGMIRNGVDTSPIKPNAGPVSAEERALRFGHRAAHVRVHGPEELAEALERALWERGAAVVRLDEIERSATGPLLTAGLLVLTWQPAQTASLSFSISAEEVGDVTDVPSALAALHQAGVLLDTPPAVSRRATWPN